MTKRATATEEPTGVLIGYARVSTEDQNLALQEAALSKAGVEEHRIYREKRSGVVDNRPQLKQALKACRPGDTLIVWKFDRLGRSMLDLLTKLKWLSDNGIQFRSLTDNIDTVTPMGKFMVHLLGALAQFERDLISERTRAGVRRRQEEGLPHGAPLKMTDAAKTLVVRRFREGRSVREVAAELGVAGMTIYSHFPGGPGKYLKQK